MRRNISSLGTGCNKFLSHSCQEGFWPVSFSTCAFDITAETLPRELPRFQDKTSTHVATAPCMLSSLLCLWSGCVGSKLCFLCIAQDLSTSEGGLLQVTLEGIGLKFSTRRVSLHNRLIVPHMVG